MVWNFEKYEKNIAAVEDTGISISYGDLKKESEKLAVNIEQRCLVFSLCSNCIGSLLGYTAFLNHNIVPLLLSEELEQELLTSLIAAYKPDYLWVSKYIRNKFSDYKEIYTAYDYVLLKTDYHFVYSLYSELGLLLTTSGSTGSPKLVRQTYHNIISNANAIAEYLELDNTERPITTLPMNYTYGLSIINSHLLVGAAILFTNKTLMEKEFWKYFKERQATSFGGVPYTYEILKKLRFFNMELPSLRTMTQAGGKLSPELHHEFAEFAQKKNIHFIVMYGQTEATARMAYLPYQKSLEKYGSMGIAIPGGKFELIDINGNEILEEDAVGELVYRGENVTLGYALQGEDLIKGDENLGILITGDMAKRDKDGFYYIVGRKKRFLKIYGNRVNLDEIERMIKTYYPQIDCACAGKDDKMYVFITEKECKESVRHFVAEKTRLNISGFHVVEIEEIPKNDAGKTLYVKLEKYYD